MNISDFNPLDERLWGTAMMADHPQGGVLWLRRPRVRELVFMHELLLKEVSSDAGSLEAMTAVFAHNPDTFWLIERREPGEYVPNKVGFYSYLVLNQQGHEALLAGALNRKAPPLSMLAPYGVEPAALYIWAVVARGLLKSTRPLIAHAMGPLYRDAPMYATVATEDGRRAGESRGFTPADRSPEIQVGTLMKLPPWSQREAA